MVYHWARSVVVGVECVIIAHFIRRNESHWPIDTFSVRKSNMARLCVHCFCVPTTRDSSAKQQQQKKNHLNETDDGEKEEEEEDDEAIAHIFRSERTATAAVWVCALYYELMMSSRNQLLVVEYSVRWTASRAMTDAHTHSSLCSLLAGNLRIALRTRTKRREFEMSKQKMAQTSEHLFKRFSIHPSRGRCVPLSQNKKYNKIVSLVN